MKYILLFIQSIFLLSVCLSLTGCTGENEPAPEISTSSQPQKTSSVWDSGTHQTRAAYEKKDAPVNQSEDDEISPVSNGERTSGDGDGEITTSDALLALQMAVGKQTVNMVMDVNDDGRITSVDARKILRNALGLEALE